ncbi:MAG: VPLPA-CTERM sorting domain-containing protein [Paracoccaceae bacterium]
MTKIATVLTFFLMSLSTPISAASITGFFDEMGYAGFLGAETTFIDFSGPVGASDGVFADVDFNTIGVVGSDLVSSSGAGTITDAGDPFSGNGVGRIEGEFSSDVFAIGLHLLGVNGSGEIAIFDSSDTYVGVVGFHGNGFFGISSDMAFRRFEIRTHDFENAATVGTDFDRVSVDTFRINDLTPVPSAVPLPASGAMLIASLAVLMSRRRKTKVHLGAN